ncbi:hypothetical protein SAMN04515665_103159 [Blastococcus sp. DSM 46786]|nr:hypothetical protein SAMN04515665_103159 [Blastococcus sp. DSM 46786]
MRRSEAVAPCTPHGAEQHRSIDPVVETILIDAGRADAYYVALLTVFQKECPRPVDAFPPETRVTAPPETPTDSQPTAT